MILLSSALIITVVLFWRTDAFQIQHHQPKTFRTTTRLFNNQGVISLERTAQRQVDQFQGWAVDCGVQAENGFCLVGNMVDGNEDYYAATSTGAAEGERVLYVPGEMILSASRIAEEYTGYVDPSLKILEEKEFAHLIPQFYLFLKILLEYEQGIDSPYYPWMESLPRKWNTAVSFDSFCMSTLPPYIKKVARAEREQLDAFKAALKVFDYLSPESKKDEELMKFAYNVVFTRSWPNEQDGDVKIVPVADYFNHDYPDNIALYYNEYGDCEVIVKEDVAPGSALTMSYGMPTNPSQLLATYGFLNEAPATYCKILFTNPSQKLIDVGYDPDKLLFFTDDGGISQEVWDVMLYSKLERTPNMADAKNAFYQAHMTGDDETKFAIHREFQDATCRALLDHVENILKEVDQMTDMMLKFKNEEKHPRLPLLLRHHAMVSSTFMKVRENLLEMPF